MESKYGGRIAGYFPGNGVYGEWLSWKSYWEIEPGAPPPGKIGFEDYSEPAHAAFRQWLRARYSRVEDLRRAWGDPAVTFETASVPSEDIRKRPTQASSSTLQSAARRPTILNSSMISFPTC